MTVERYLRHSLIDWFDQDTLKKARIVVVGAGAVGNEVLKNLTLLGVGRILLLDFDRIEAHNLTRCVLFRESDVGRYKCDAAAEACRNLDANVEIVARNGDYWDELRFDDLDSADALISCVDNFEARLGLNTLCMMTGTDFYNTGIDSRYASVELFPYAAEPDCACYECNLPPSVYKKIQDRYSCGYLKKIAFEEKKIPTTTVTASVAGAFAVSVLLHRLCRHETALRGACRCMFDSISLASMVSTYERNEDCPTCSRIEPGSERISARRVCSPEQSPFPAADEDAEVVLSEPVLLRGQCKSCGKEVEFFESTRRLTDAVSVCPDCRTNSMELRYAERMPLAEFEAAFSGRNVPCKFLVCQSGGHHLTVELED